MTEHTALPWRVQPMPPNVGGCRSIQANKSGTHKQAQWRTEICYTVGLSNDNEDKANARLIVTACNCHDDLLEVAKAAFGLIDKLGEYDDEVSVGNALVLLALKKQASEAIRKAEEQSQ